MRLKRVKFRFQAVLTGCVLLLASMVMAAQTDAAPQAAPSSPSSEAPYQPKFHGDPAHSDSEAIALGYMRTVLRAQRQYEKKNGKYAPSLMDLVHTGSFTRRMVDPHRGDYTAAFHSHKDGFEMTMTPQNMDANHRSFYADEKGIIHGDDQKAADESSPVVK
jgi:hypothetical protein